MKTTATLLLFLISIFNISAQDWVYDFEEAKSLAAHTDKKIILVFSGSDWCVPCIKLSHQVFKTEMFKNYAKEHFIMLKADFPRRKENQLSEAQKNHNAKLFEKYNKMGYFPLVVVLTKKGRAIGELSFRNETPEQYIYRINSF